MDCLGRTTCTEHSIFDKTSHKWIDPKLKSIAKVSLFYFYIVAISVQRAAILFLERHRRICTKESRIPIGLGYCIIKPIKSLALMKWNSPPFLWSCLSFAWSGRSYRLHNSDNTFMKSHLFIFLSLWSDEVYIIEDKDRNEFVKYGATIVDFCQTRQLHLGPHLRPNYCPTALALYSTKFRRQ